MKAPARIRNVLPIATDDRLRGRGEERARCKQVLARMGMPGEWLDPPFGEYLEHQNVQYPPIRPHRFQQKVAWAACVAGASAVATVALAFYWMRL